MKLQRLGGSQSYWYGKLFIHVPMKARAGDVRQVRPTPLETTRCSAGSLLLAVRSSRGSDASARAVHPRSYVGL
eukprot:s888_g6.t1